ncbi:MAG: XylR family transcriptional regulator [Pirellulales bacterium]
MVEKLGLPTVDLSAARLLPALPWVETDDAAIARTAVQHLRERGFRRLAFCGEPRFNWSRLRGEHFVRCAAEHDCTVDVFEMRGPGEPRYSWTRERERLLAWITGLEKPVGIFACYDILGQRILDVCRDADTAVPEQVAVLGVDNDDLICSSCGPPLSSVITDARRTGYEAARLLDERLHGVADGQNACLLIPPIGVAARQSTDLVAIDDPHVALALRLIREQAAGGAKVADIVRGVPLSRRALEARFRTATGRTPHDYLLGYRLERARQLLRETEFTLDLIARRSGFGCAEYLAAVFRRETGATPGEYRRKSQG